MISSCERNNFLSRCWHTGRWADGAAILLLPVRLPIYHLRRKLLRRTTRPAGDRRNTPRLTGNVSATVHSPFAASLPQAEPVAGLQELFAEARAQIGGEYRLAGGSLRNIADIAWERVEDSENHHAYHRLQWAVRYSRAAAFGCADAKQALSRDLSRWLAVDWDADPVCAAPYNVAERIASLAECLAWMPDLLVTAVKQRIWTDAGLLAGNIEYGLGIHNHLLNNARGLYIAAAALPDRAEAAAWGEQAFQIWDEYFPKLVLADGTFAEQSSHYHLLLCRTALEYWLAAEKCGRDMPVGFETRLRGMFRLANDLLRPDGTLSRFGDNSPDHTVEDLWGLMATAWHYGLLTEVPRHQVVTPLTLYYGGTTARLPQRDEDTGVRIYSNGGFGILRSPECELIAHGDPRSESAPHGDAGRGSFEIWRQNEILVREPGSSWSSDPDLRFHRTGKAQNVTCLNGVAPGITAEDGGYLPAWYSTQSGSWDEPQDGAIRFRWDGFRRVNPDIACTRMWRFESDGDLTLEEHIEGYTQVKFESRVCLGNASWGPLTWDKATGRGEMSHALARMSVEGPPDTSARIQECTYFEEYGVERKGKVLSLAARPTLPLTWRLSWSFRGN